MRVAQFILALLLCGCATPKVDSSKQQAETDFGQSVATFSVVDGYTPGPLHLDTSHLVSQADTQFPVDVIVDAGCGVVVMRYLNPDPEVYSPITFDGGTDANAFYLLRARTPNASITNWTTNLSP